MQRARRAADAALALVVALCLSSVPAATPLMGNGIARAATVPWPPSTLVISELQTGGASASDEFVEIANQGAASVDLVGLELVYATSSGSTVTRKGTWPASTILAPGRRFLVVNSAGSHAAIGDVIYSGGFAATGGAVALRIIGGSVIDAVAWGDATNPFVEGTAAPAPAAGASLERRPGGVLGNGLDTNDNAVDWFESTTPGPQGFAAPPVPDPGPGSTPTLEPTPGPTSEPTPDPTPDPTPEPSASPTSAPTATPTPEPTLEPTPTPTAEPTPTATPTPDAISAVRAMPDGTFATIAGVLTTDLGALESGHTAFVQDETGGIALYLDAVVVSAIPIGITVTVRGTVDDRFAQRTLRIAEGDLVATGVSGLPLAPSISTGVATETFEGTRIQVGGPVTAGPDALSDGTAVTVDDGSGPVRVIVTPDALGGRELATGSVVTATGPLGQRDSSGTGAEGYRLYVTSASDILVAPPPTPAPTATPAPSPSPTGEPTPAPTASPTPTPSSIPSPSPTPSGLSIAAARLRSIGSTVTVRGVVTAEAGRLGTPSLLAIGDATGGIVVKLPDGLVGPARGQAIVVAGALADPYGQLEVRPPATGLTLDGVGSVPEAVDLPPSGPSESTEGRLVRLTGTVVARPTKSTSGDIALTLETSNGTRIRITADASSGLGQASFVPGARYRLLGISGQRASRKGAPDGYRVWVRDRHDVTLLAAAPSPTAGSSGSPKSSGGTPARVPIASALRTTDRDVAIEAVVTAPASLLDGSGRRIVVQDSTGAIEVLLPKDVSAPGVGARVLAIGRIGSAYGAPRLRASSIERRGAGTVPRPLRLAGPLSPIHAWGLVEISGRVDDVRKLGERWRAEIVLGAQRFVVVGQPGARIPNTALGEGRAAYIVGIVRPPYPSASDRRPSILPRSGADIRQGAAAATGTTPGPSGNGASTSPTAGGAATSPGSSATPADLIDLLRLVGTEVLVGGLVVELRSDGFDLDDGTAIGRVVLAGLAADAIDLVEPGDAINVTGLVTIQSDGVAAVVVEDPIAIVLGSTLGALGASAAPPDPVASHGGTATSGLRTAGFGSDGMAIPGAGAGLVGLLTVGLLSAAMTLLRRRHARRLLALRVAARLAAVGGSHRVDEQPATGPHTA